MAGKSKGVSRKQDRRRFAAYTLLVALVGLSLAAATGEMGAYEAHIFDWMYSMPDSLRWFALVATQLGHVWVVIGIVGLLFVIRKNPLLSLMVLRNSLLAYVTVEFTKFIVSRPRPMILLSEVTSREVAVFGNGFPSAHTALATVVSLTLMPYLPRRLRWLPIIWIGVVAWSRMYLGVHAPLDVLGGFIIGLLVILMTDVIPWPSQKHPRKR